MQNEFERSQYLVFLCESTNITCKLYKKLKKNRYLRSLLGQNKVYLQFNNAMTYDIIIPSHTEKKLKKFKFDINSLAFHKISKGSTDLK